MPEIEIQMVKILNGREHILTVEQAAERLGFFGLKCERIEDLRCPFEIAWPFRMGARDFMGDHIVEVKGTYPALCKLQEMAWVCEQPKEINHFHWPGKNPEPYKVKLERGMKGAYAWEITYQGEDPASVVERVQAIDLQLRRIYLGEMTAPEQAAPKAEEN